MILFFDHSSEYFLCFVELIIDGSASKFICIKFYFGIRSSSGDIYIFPIRCISLADCVFHRCSILEFFHSLDRSFSECLGSYELCTYILSEGQSDDFSCRGGKTVYKNNYRKILIAFISL